MTMRRMPVESALILFVLCGSPASAEANFNFKGIPLGISLEKFRQFTHPDGSPNARVVCTGDQESFGAELEVTVLDSSERKIGITKCVFYGKLTDDDFSNSIIPLNMGGGNFASWNYEFSFAPDSMKLYKIVLPTNIGAMPDTLDALNSKFGSPTRTKTGSVQNLAGAKLNQKTILWSKEGHSILVRGPWTKVDNLVVIYTDDKVDSAIGKKIKASKANGM